MSTNQPQKSWQYREVATHAPGLNALADTLIELAEEGYPVVAGSADVMYSNNLVKFAERFPDRYIQFGISEQNMVSAAAGLTTTGAIPFVGTFASFLALLCCEQIRTDVAYCARPVRLIGHHSGISMGFYGTSHHATEDLAIMRSIPDLTVINPADSASLAAAIRASVDHPHPIYFRMSRGQEPEVYEATSLNFEIGKAIEHSQGEDLTLIACGIEVHPALEAAKVLRSRGVSVGVIDMHTIKPIDREVIIGTGNFSKKIMTIEEHSVIGGLGGAVAEVITDEGLPIKLCRHGIYDEYALIGPPTHLYRHYQLDSEGIVKKAEQFLGGKNEFK
ncbi:transketolase family protein [Motiliproteus sp. MSK22-1]|uniref:transketolase family protein n=1 Tax=Motiliproteus sp. MSK22-1 TaxID=1897630 RepID=UPI0009787867|nr:transketolase C-terminal domain-containing protein [Motiliproteus sp. MSK22-1]OMH37969.1 transketolase [Motiliproteus sp. MSK22-1]